MNDFSKKLSNCKQSYPFDFWYRLHLKDKDNPYSKENCNMIISIFDSLIDELIKLGQSAEQEQKVALIKFSVERLNTIAKSNSVLIETQERSELIDLFDEIAIVSGVNLNDFEYGLTSEWREW